MEFIEFIEKLKSLQRENDKLKEEIRSLQIQLGIGELTKGKHEFFAPDTEIKVPKRAFLNTPAKLTTFRRFSR